MKRAEVPVFLLGQELSMMAAGGLLLCLLLAAGSGPSWPLAALRLLLAGFFVLFAPGYVLLAALFPSPDRLGGAERMGLSIGLSLAVVPTLALILDKLPWGINVWSIAAVLAVFLCVCSVPALYRRRRLPANARPQVVRVAVRDASVVQPTGAAQRPLITLSIGSELQSILRSPRASRVQAVMFAGLILLVILVALSLAIAPRTDQPQAEFYLLPDASIRASAGLAPGVPFTVMLGIVNHASVQHTYTVEVWAGAASQRVLLQQYGPFTLTSGQSLEWPASWRMSQTGPGTPVELLLFADQGREPYRRLLLQMGTGAS